MRHLTLIVLALGLFFATAQLSRGQVPPMTLPSRFEDQVLLRASVNGHDMWFSLNTAVRNAGLAKAAAASANVTADDAGRVEGDLALGPLHMHDARFSLVAGEQEAKNFTPISGQIGGSLFRSNIVTIDFPKTTVVAYAPGDFDASHLQRNAIAIDLTRGVPIVQVMFGDKPARMLIATAANRTMIFRPFADDVTVGPAHKYVNDPRFGEDVTIGPTPMRVGDARFGTQRIPAQQYQVKPMTIGPYRFAAPVIGVVDRPPDWIVPLGIDGVFGREMLRPFRVTFDYADSVMYLDR